jgi:hypothetical protein
MLLLPQLISKTDSRFSGGLLGGAVSSLRRWLGRNFNFLLFVLSCYIVVSRIGPFVSRAGDLAIETFEVERRIVEEFDHEALRLFRDAFLKFRVVTRAPYPVLLFGRAPQESSPVPELTMGGRSSKPAGTGVKTSSESGDQATKQEVTPLENPPQTSSETAATPSAADGEQTEQVKWEQQEQLAEGEAGSGDGEGREKSTSPTAPVPHKRLDEIRNESSPSFSIGSTESIIGLFEPERLNPAEFKKPVKFKKIQPTIRTGDLALLYRRDEEIPHVAIFINHVETDPLFPLLLVKGKTKPLPLAKFHPQKCRFIHPITATTRIFYGDYERVAVRYVQSDDGIDVQQAMDAIAAVEAVPFSEKERKAISDAATDHERSLYMSTFMAAYYYRELGVFTGTPDEVTPENFLAQLPLSDPLYIKLPSVKLGPMVNGDPPFLKQLVDGIYPQQDVRTLPYDKAIEGLDTGDLILFSGATSQGAIIKFFDHSQFSHVAMVLKAKYTSQLLIWEASTNHAKLVDVQAGTVRTGVEVLPLRNKIFSGWYDRVAIRRLLNITAEKRQDIYTAMLRLRKEWMGRAYEKNLVQMALSAINPSDTFLSLFQNTQEDLSSLFCSELVAAAYQRMNLIKGDRPSNGYTPDDFSSARDSGILSAGVELSEEIYVELKWPKTALSTQESVY